MIKHTYLRYLLLIACFAPCASFATGTQTNCTQAVEQALRAKFESFDQTIFDRDRIDDLITNKMNTTLKNVMETASDCQNNDAKKDVHGHFFDIGLKNHTFAFQIEVTASNSNNGHDGRNGDDVYNPNEEIKEAYVYVDQTPAGYSSKYYLMFDNGNYDTEYKDITEIAEFQQTTATKSLWPKSCSQHENPHQQTIKNDRVLNKTIRENQTQVFGGLSNRKYEYFLNLKDPARTSFPYDTIGILFYAPNGIHRYPVTEPFAGIEKTREIRENIAEQLKTTSCTGLKIYILEERTSNSDNAKKIYIHPNPITIQ